MPMDPREEPAGSLDDDESDESSTVDYVSEASDAESTASAAAADALADVIAAVERRVDRERRRAAVYAFVRRFARRCLRAALALVVGVALAAAAAALERERGAWLIRCPAHAPCVDARVACAHAVVEPFSIPEGRAGDGVEDCCGGSDEHEIDKGACVDAARSLLDEARRDVLRQEISMEARRVLAAEAPVRAAQAAVEDMQLRADEQRFSELQPRSYGEAQQLQAVRQKIQRLRIEALGAVHADPELFGADGAWLALRGQCFDSLPVSEKSVLGGTSNVVARFYVFRLCPFRNVTQREADHFEWKKATARAEGKKLKRSSPPAPTVLGEFQVWADTNDARHPLYFSQRQLVVSEASARGARQVYEGGEPCAGDRQRVVIVRPMCASTTRLVRVDEDGVCNYLMDLETPAACRGVGVSRVRDLERRLAYPRVYATARSAMSFGARLWRRSMILLLRVTGRRPVGAWVLRVEAGLAYGRARVALYLGS